MIIAIICSEHTICVFLLKERNVVARKTSIKGTMSQIQKLLHEKVLNTGIKSLDFADNYLNVF